MRKSDVDPTNTGSLIQGGQYDTADLLLRFICDHRITVLNVVGSRASKEPDIAAFVDKVLEEAFFLRPDSWLGGPGEGWPNTLPTPSLRDQSFKSRIRPAHERRDPRARPRPRPQDRHPRGAVPGSGAERAPGLLRPNGQY